MTLDKCAASLQVAVVQAGAVPFDAEACVDKAIKLIADAAATGAKLIVFPEAFVTGYPKGLNFGLAVGARDAVGREEFRLYLDAAIEVPGQQTQRMGDAAATHGCYVVMGVIERERGTCYCTVLFFGPDGRLLGKHRKLMPTALERMIWGFGDGSTLTVVDSPYGRIGAVICWENYMPMLRMAMYSKNVALYCAPTADDRDTWLPSMRHVALEGRCFVLTACQFLRKNDFPDSVRVSLGDTPDAILMRGGSAIVSPLGTVLAGPYFGGESILTATLDLNEIGRGKFDFDVAGHYSRPDVFQLTVNEAPMSAVVTKNADA
jgi:nitrilase